MSGTDSTGTLIDRLLALPPDERIAAVRAMTAAQRREFLARWEAWAHGGQLAPPGDWRVWLIRAGRGFGKTRAGAEWVCEVAQKMPEARIALVGASADDVRQVMIEGPSGVLRVARADQTPTWRATTGEVRWPNGTVARVYSAEAPERLRGPEHHAAWCDELAKWRLGDATWDNLVMTMRLGDRPRVVVTTTPRPTRLMRRIMALPSLVETRGATRDNPHLPDSFVGAMREEYGGTLLGRQELEGELIEEVAGALWTRGLLERCRTCVPAEAVRTVVGVDPPAGVGGDACGIVAVALGRDGVAYVIEDASVNGATPEGWARAVAACAARVAADRVVAEKNQGGAMVGSVLKAADAGLPLTLVHAAQGKVARAEPVALLYEAGRVRHAGAFPALEDELCGLVAGGSYEGPGRSPDRADALVWAVSELMLGKRSVAAVRGL
ncbi:ATP-binding protein [Sphingomonas sp. EC-HK361]|uniref:DNA-packaging protein n=1 Tax=Sphingomonas sp. EC-HK361 TaxID=2038397 RepID=UPI001250FD43|nr:terminase family protein [Sphingomonas sp. EC-HK361]VVT00301.1 ATP-binding protein [Sphingomonas sp. EC-HK361]